MLGGNIMFSLVLLVPCCDWPVLNASSIKVFKALDSTFDFFVQTQTMIFA